MKHETTIKVVQSVLQRIKPQRPLQRLIVQRDNLPYTHFYTIPSLS